MRFLEREATRRLMLFTGRASRDLAERIARHLGIELGRLELRTFPSGELYARFDESVRGADVYLVQSTCHPTNETLMELLVMIDAARLASAHRIVAVVPSFGYARQDKKSAPREPVTARLVADLIEAAGAHRVLTMDLHSGQIQGFFKVPVDHMTAQPVIVDHFSRRIASGEITRPVVVSPDVGRVRLANRVAERLGAELAVLAKQRAPDGEAHVTLLIGDVAGRTAIMLDDMIDTGGTLVAGAASLRQGGASRILAAATHGVFSDGALERLARAGIQEIAVTDTIPPPQNGPLDVLRVLSVDRLLADSIRASFDDGSVSAVFAGETQLF